MVTKTPEQPGCGTDFWLRSQYFATARAGVHRCCAGPETRFATRYRPKLGKQRVRLTTTPDDGYLTHDEALNAAREFRNLCRGVLATAQAADDTGERSNTDPSPNTVPSAPGEAGRG